jgi:capsular polysaccharide biosynthesis protein
MVHRKQPNPVLQLAQTYVREQLPELQNAALCVRTLDGPPDAPRYSVTAEVCIARPCPHGVPATIAATGQCTVHSCPLRCSVRLLLDEGGAVLQATRSGIHWG